MNAGRDVERVEQERRGWLSLARQGFLSFEACCSTSPPAVSRARARSNAPRGAPGMLHSLHRGNAPAAAPFLRGARLEACRPPLRRPARTPLVAPRALVNVDFGPGLILGTVLIGSGIVLYQARRTLVRRGKCLTRPLQVRTVRPEVSRDSDVFFSSLGLLCGGILVFQGWRLDVRARLRGAPRTRLTSSLAADTLLRPAAHSGDGCGVRCGDHQAARRGGGGEGQLRARPA